MSLKKIITSLTFLTFLLLGVGNVDAAVSIWDFSSTGDYTISNTNKAQISANLAQLSAISEFQVNDEIESIVIGTTEMTAKVLSNGNVLLSWLSNDSNHSTNAVGQDNDNSSDHIAAKVYSADGSTVIIPEFQVNDEIQGFQRHQDVAILPNGNVVFVWQSFDTSHSTNAVGQDNDNSGYHISAKIYSADMSTVVTPEFQVNDGVHGSQIEPSVSVLSNNNIVFSWLAYASGLYDYSAPGQDSDDSGYHVAAKVYSADASSVVIPQIQVNDEVESNQWDTKINILDNNNVLFSWYSFDTNHTTNLVGQDNDNDLYHIAGKIYSADMSTVVTPEFQINDEVESAQYHQEVTKLSNGNILFVWESTDSSHSSNVLGQSNDNNLSYIVAKIYSADMSTVVTPEFQINDEIDDRQEYPSVTLLDNNNILFAWASADTNHTTNSNTQDNDNLNHHVSGKIYSADGSTVIKPEFQVNDEIDNFQWGVGITGLSNGNILFAWESYDTNHSSNVVGQSNDNNASYLAAKIYSSTGTSLSYTTSPSIVPNTGMTYTQALSSFVETTTGNHTGTISYQLSPDNGVTWYYHDGASWVTTVADVTESNSAADVNTNIGTFHSDAGTGTLVWKVFLTSDGSQVVELDEVKVVITETDTDGDGLPDTIEAQIGTDPTLTDTDGDGNNDDNNDNDNVSPIVELNANNNGDGNGDGTLDAIQPDVASLPNATTIETNSLDITDTTSSCTQITRFSSLTEDDLTNKDNNYDYDVGLWDLEVSCIIPGETVDITIYLDDEYDTDKWTYRKFNASSGEYTDIDSYVTYGTATVGTSDVTTISYSVTDGGPLDDDGLVNGMIVDPSGPGAQKEKSKGSNVKYVCKDETASNYDDSSFARHKDSKCEYDTLAQAETPTEDNPFGGNQCPANLIINDFMKRGNRNGNYGSYNRGIVTEIDILQGHMNRLLLDEYGNQAAGPIDGIFGPLTHRGVERLQTRLNQLLEGQITPLVIDGIVGPFTRAAINMSC